MLKTDSEPSVQSINRAIQVLRCFEKTDKLGLTEISKAIGLHKSTTYGIVTTLKNNGLLEKNEETGKYRLGIELYRIAANARVDLREIAQPRIRQICEVTGETVNLVIPDDTHVIYIEKRESEYSVKSGTSIGKRLPMYCTAVGKSMLAYLPSAEVSGILDRTRLVALTKNTLTSKEALIKQLEQVRENGFALDVEELEYGLICVAAPILNVQGRPIASLSCSGPKQRMTSDRLQMVSEVLLKHTRELSRLVMDN